MLKEMKVDFSSLNNRVNSHANVVKQLEGQLSQLSAQLEPKVIERGEVEYTTTLRVDFNKDLADVTRSEKIVVGNAKGNDEVEAYEEEKDIDDEEKLIQQPKSDIVTT
uniref:Integrase core domain containing protein n=1 Tax=Solanum tuberosum TaxID=4113 RepID=M1DUW1_SOLTU